MSPKGRKKGAEPIPKLSKVAGKKATAAAPAQPDLTVERRITRSQSKRVQQEAEKKATVARRRATRAKAPHPTVRSRREHINTASKPKKAIPVSGDNSGQEQVHAVTETRNKPHPPRQPAAFTRQPVTSSSSTEATFGQQSQSTESLERNQPSQQSRIYSSDERLPDEFYRLGGYSPPSENMSSTARGTPAPRGGSVKSTEGEDRNRLKPAHAEFGNVLMDRYISTEADDDDEMDEWRKLLIPDAPSNTDPEKEKQWTIDMRKCEISNEAIFQRTVMMSLFDRHNLHGILDYACEDTWNSDTATSMPSQGSFRVAGFYPSRPRPDLAVFFKSKALLPDQDTTLITRLQHLQGYMCPEGTKGQAFRRAMPFLSVEGKGQKGKYDGIEASMQNLNAASTALYNMYRIMAEAGDEDEFFKEIRFFSVSASSERFEVRIHRPVKLVKLIPEGVPYRVGYRFDRLVNAKQDSYTRAFATGIISNILTKYGVEKLFPILQKTLLKVLERGVEPIRLVNEPENGTEPDNRGPQGPPGPPVGPQSDREDSTPPPSTSRVSKNRGKRRSTHGARYQTQAESRGTKRVNPANVSFESSSSQQRRRIEQLSF